MAIFIDINCMFSIKKKFKVLYFTFYSFFFLIAQFSFIISFFLENTLHPTLKYFIFLAELFEKFKLVQYV